MFTGIIETIGTIRSHKPNSSGIELGIENDFLAGKLAVDDSIAVNGICLTVVKLLPKGFLVDAITETLARSTLPEWRPNKKVNLERGMPANGRFDGHMVQGHVDGQAELIALVRRGRSKELTFKCDPALLELMVEKGSVAIDGMSLTIAKIEKNQFTIAVIPYTLENTTFNNIQRGHKVNIETDIIGKYLAKFMQSKNKIDTATLRSWGYEL